jgi:L-histidine N-alpha-methyltransferase
MRSQALEPDQERLLVDTFLDPEGTDADRDELRASLDLRPPRIPSRYFYDARGSQLFERITELPEYYQTRAERGLLERVAEDVIERTGANELVEIGSGAATKTRLLLDAMRRAELLRCYVPFDVDPSIVQRVGEELIAEYPDLLVHGVVGNFLHEDFLNHLDGIPRRGQRLIAFLGGTIGNLRPPVAHQLLRSIGHVLQPGEHFLLGVDLVKDRARLEAAYNDAEGITAEFNRNILRVINQRFDADFDPQAFDHRAVWDPEHRWIEMHLIARSPQRVTLRDLDRTLRFDAGQYLLTEISAKYDQPRVAELLAAGGLQMVAWYTDPDPLFALALARR